MRETVWGKKKPTEPGLYWYSAAPGFASVVNVIPHHKHGLCVARLSNGFSVNTTYESVKDMKGRWSNKIEPPDDPETWFVTDPCGCKWTSSNHPSCRSGHQMSGALEKACRRHR